MQPIPFEFVEKTWREMSLMGPPMAMELVEKMGREQPAILAYLMAAGMDDLTQQEHEMLLYIGLVVWQMMHWQNQVLPEIQDSDLENMERKNIQMLEYLSEEPEQDFADTIRFLWEGYNQQEVLRYVIEALVEEDEEEEDFWGLHDEQIAYMFICLKTIIDCLDAAIEA